MVATYREPARRSPVLAEYGVVVCGGGAAGCAASITAARHGARTLFIKRDGFLGGATVYQLVSHVLRANGVDFRGVWPDHDHGGDRSRACQRRDQSETATRRRFRIDGP